jgi:hypothetical protein
MAFPKGAPDDSGIVKPVRTTAKGSRALTK